MHHWFRQAAHFTDFIFDVAVDAEVFILFLFIFLNKNAVTDVCVSECVCQARREAVSVAREKGS